MHDTGGKMKANGRGGIGWRGLLACAVVAGWSGCSDSSRAPVRPTDNGSGALTAQLGPWSIELVDELERPLSAWAQGGATWVLGQHGVAYGVRIHNGGGERIEAVVSVDGRDVLSGEPGDFRKQRGYVLDPGESTTVRGFQASASDVATFRFTHPGDAYATRRGSAAHLGVVGVAVFPEGTSHPAPIARDPGEDDGRAKWGSGPERTQAEAQAGSPTASADREPSARQPGGGQNLGTQYGERRFAPVTEVAFRRRADTPAAVLAVYYDDHEGLRSRGILPPLPPPGPNPFPANSFAPPPP